MSETALGSRRPIAPPGADSVSGWLAELAGEMRARGSRVGVGELLGAHLALAAVDPADPQQAFLALRAAICAGHEDLERFSAAFRSCFSRATPAGEPWIDPVATLVLPRMVVPENREARIDLAELEEVRPAAWSEIELLREKDFADYSDRERALARAVLARLARRGPTRRARRTRSSHRRASRLDLRGTLRASLRHGGEPLGWRWRRPRRRPRPLVLVCDVSGSMDPYARMLLAYAHACVQVRGRCEAFAFSTRLTRITRELGGRDPDAALHRAAAAAGDWSGGTRIGEALAALNREHGRRVGRGAVVVVLSDGWDCGDPAELEREVARLARCAHRLVWLNPLKAAPDYEPLARGMAAALPNVDLFIAGNTIASLERLAMMMEQGFEAGASTSTGADRGRRSGLTGARVRS